MINPILVHCGISVCYQKIGTVGAAGNLSCNGGVTAGILHDSSNCAERIRACVLASQLKQSDIVLVLELLEDTRRKGCTRNPNRRVTESFGSRKAAGKKELESGSKCEVPKCDEALERRLKDFGDLSSACRIQCHPNSRAPSNRGIQEVAEDTFMAWTRFPVPA
uniref:Uncharacterized protein n=1 Tax=Ascaris lumbricoides TaxID=6252 RepID=A0A0M3HYH8_ASCLU